MSTPGPLCPWNNISDKEEGEEGVHLGRGAGGAEDL